jgi:iron(III) transport system substrate-binding protein
MNRRQFLAAAAVAASGCSRRDSRVVLYCAQDQEFAEDLLAEFTQETGLAVATKFDTEAQKSVGLAAELEQEAGRPRCDVHWNNEPLGTIRLARKGVYEPYSSPNATPFPDWSRAPDQTWQAFAARARVLIVNTRLVPAEADRPRSILDLVNAKWKGRVAIAKPFFGTTATHAACLFDILGPDAATSLFTGLIGNGVAVVAGNKQVATEVSGGRFAVGFTDTDDALIELQAGKPVAIVYPDRDGHPVYPKLGTLFLPNTLAIVKNGPNPAAARTLIDFLLRPTMEAKLAEGGGFQIPLNPTVQVTLPPGLLTPSQVKPMDADFGRATDRWEETQTTLRKLFGG